MVIHLAASYVFSSGLESQEVHPPTVLCDSPKKKTADILWRCEIVYPPTLLEIMLSNILNVVYLIYLMSCFDSWNSGTMVTISFGYD